MAVTQAKGAIESAEAQSKLIVKVTDQLIEASTRVAASGADVLGGVFGGSLFALIGLALGGAVALPLYALPFVSVIGISLGVFASRGLESIRGDRKRRELELDRQSQLEAAEDYFKLLEAGVKRGLLEKSAAQEQAREFVKLRMLPSVTMEPKIEASLVSDHAEPRLLSAPISDTSKSRKNRKPSRKMANLVTDHDSNNQEAMG